MSEDEKNPTMIPLTCWNCGSTDEYPDGETYPCTNECGWKVIVRSGSLHSMWVEIVPGLTAPPTPDHYAPLREFLDAALERASKGKGAERHADGNPFTEQPILAISRLLGSPDGQAYQIIKKAIELRGLEPEAAMRECLDIAVYAAGMWCWFREGGEE